MSDANDAARAGRGPWLLELGPGTYRWCACGRTRSPPFCDDSHAGTEVQPLGFRVPEGPASRTVWLCGCRRSKTLPFCDGSHNRG